ncbi:MAG: hypothetical protein K2I63_03350, partial [Helicobacter sp.]|nr:hypothetical protein [Helicobacter sp.]
DSSSQEIQNLRILLEQKERQLETLLTTRNAHVVSEDSIIKPEFPIRFSIKPKKEIIAECFSMEIGKWKIPKGCLLSLATKIHEELERDYKVVAFEVQGIVDTNPYHGLSSELKQEGLASFRAKEAIREINNKFPNTAVFEGASVQIPDKRGYRIKAYFYNDF